MDNLNILTLNVNGNIKNENYQQTLISFFDLNNINIALLQETHIGNIAWKRKVDNLFQCNSYWSFGSMGSRGVAILFFNNFQYEVINFEKDIDGRVISVKIKSDYGIVKLISVYCPNEAPERKNFLSTLDSHIFGPYSIVMGGDWNCVENISLDKQGGNPNKGAEGAEIIK